MLNISSRWQKTIATTIVFLQKHQTSPGKCPVDDSRILSQLAHITAGKAFQGECGEIFPVADKKQLTIFAGLGDQENLSLTKLRILVRKALTSGYADQKTSVQLLPHAESENDLVAYIEGVLLGTYCWDKYITTSKKSLRPHDQQVYLVTKKTALTDAAIKTCEGTNLCRDLINDNADIVTADHFEKLVRKMVKGHKNIKVEILNEKEMKAKGLGFHLAVNQGSAKEPKLIIVRYTGNPKTKKYTALVGKGMTFDTGGLNLKPSGSIENMRCDMSGAAAIAGVLSNTIALNLRKNVIFAMSMAENVTGSLAYKPGDVITGYAGKTVEVANTDAEGRLVLADAISYITKNYRPDAIIDIATLTGACVVALGLDYSGLVSSDDELARELEASAAHTDDRAWRLPIYPELKESVKSQIADIRNLGSPRGAAGTITAAEFLRQFAEGTRWAHLDIAGTAFNDGQRKMYYGFGATGAGVRLLTDFLTNH